MNPNSKISPPKKAPKFPSEKEFYARRAQRAGKASMVAAAGLVKSLLRVLHPKAWARQYPLPTAGASLAAGFLLTRKACSASPPQKQAPMRTSSPTFNRLSQWSLATLSDILKSALIPVLRDSLNSIKKPRNQDPPEGTNP